MVVDRNAIMESFEEYFFTDGHLPTINSDGTVDCEWDITLIKSVKKLPITFREVSGEFNCLRRELTSFSGFPRVVLFSLRASGNEITSLEGSPDHIGGSFYCNNNLLVSLKGAPRRIDGDFWCNNNPLLSLEGLPENTSSTVLSWSEDVPLLRLITQNIFIIDQEPSTDLSEIIRKWHKKDGSLRSRILSCQNELIANGFGSNAKW